MANKELKTFLNDGKVQSLKPQTRTADAVGTAVDLGGYNSALIEWNFGTSGDTLSGSVKVQAVLEESDVVGSGYAAVAAASIVGTLPLVDAPGEDATIYLTAYIGSKQFIRPTLDFTGTHTNGLPTAVTVLRGHKRELQP